MVAMKGKISKTQNNNNDKRGSRTQLLCHWVHYVGYWELTVVYGYERVCTCIFGDTISNWDESILGRASESPSDIDLAPESKLEPRVKSIFDFKAGGELCEVCEDGGLFCDWKDEASVALVDLESVEDVVR